MRVRAKVKTQVDNIYRNEGEEFEYNGPPNHNLEPLDHPQAKAKSDDEDDDKHSTFSKKK